METTEVRDELDLRVAEYTKGAAACRLWAIFTPGAKRGLNRLAVRYDAVAAALMNEMVEGPVHTQADRPTNAPRSRGATCPSTI